MSHVSKVSWKDTFNKLIASSLALSLFFSSGSVSHVYVFTFFPALDTHPGYAPIAVQQVTAASLHDS